jgi:hypothetical protein
MNYLLVKAIYPISFMALAHHILLKPAMSLASLHFRDMLVEVWVVDSYSVTLADCRRLVLGTNRMSLSSL